MYFDGKVVGLEFDGKRNGLGWDGTVLGWNSGGCKDGGTDIATSLVVETFTKKSCRAITINKRQPRLIGD